MFFEDIETMVINVDNEEINPIDTIGEIFKEVEPMIVMIDKDRLDSMIDPSEIRVYHKLLFYFTKPGLEETLLLKPYIARVSELVENHGKGPVVNVWVDYDKEDLLETYGNDGEIDLPDDIWDSLILDRLQANRFIFVTSRLTDGGGVIMETKHYRK